MSYQYHGQGVPYGIPDYPNYPNNQPRQRPMNPPQARRPPPGPERQRGQRPLRPDYPSAPSNGQRFPVRPQPQQYAQPPPRRQETENLYDGSAYGESEYEENDQWPLPSQPSVSHPRNNPSNGPRRPPQRPQRPDYQQPVLDPPRPTARVAPANEQYQRRPSQQPHHGSGQWTGDGYSSPHPTYPPSGASRQPPGPQPDYQPQYQQGVYGQANKRPPLGPPPSARRGPASYYNAQIAPVHPIVEETDSVRGSVRGGSSAGGGHESMISYASSNAIPIGISNYYLQQRDSAPSIPDPPSEYGDESPVEPYLSNVRYNNGRDSPLHEREEPSPEPATLVRQASLGRKSKPTLTTVKSADKIRKDQPAEGLASLPSQQRSVSNPRQATPNTTAGPDVLKEVGMPRSDSANDSYGDAQKERFGNGDKALEAGGAAAVAAAAVSAPIYGQAKKSQDGYDSSRNPSVGALSSGTGLLDPSSSESEKEAKKKPSKDYLNAPMPTAQRQTSRERSPLAREVDPKVATILGGLEKGGALSGAETEQLKQPGAGLSERAGKRRPPRLNVDAVKEAEQRGSLTSLSDLIARATRLASNLDRGRTASRLGGNWLDGAENGDEKQRSISDKRRSGSISDMLASFPPPGLATPPGSRGRETRRSLTNWSSNLRHSHLPSDSDAGELRKQKRRCCGLPLWLFLLLLSVLVLLIAAAIIVPVVLIVVPKQDHNNSTNAASSCSTSVTCENGGATTIGSDGTCKCVCVSGYTGSTCATKSDAGCTTTTVGSTSDATLGDAIPRLLMGADSNFSVPLDGQTLLGLFSSSNMTCNSENALVTFNNAAEKRSLPLFEVFEQPTPTLQIRAASTTSSNDGATTSGGIVFETGSAPVAGSATPTSSSATSSAPSGTSTATAESSTNVDFARVAVLYVFQASGELDNAVTAQENLQTYFNSGQSSSGQSVSAQNVSLGNGVYCDLSGHSISLANGTTVGNTTMS